MAGTAWAVSEPVPLTIDVAAADRLHVAAARGRQLCPARLRAQVADPVAVTSLDQLSRVRESVAAVMAELEAT